MDKDVDGIVGANRNPFTDDVGIFLVNIGHVALLGLFDDDWVRSRVATPKLHNFATT
jgi:hypothetical protein